MIYTLKNDKLTVGISDVGAQVASAVSPDGCEYIWQADPAFWGKHGPVLFPICSSLFEGKYTYEGKTYEMGKHGFAKLMAFAGEQTSDTSVTLTLTDSDETRAVYPFSFKLSVTYTLTGDTLDCAVSIKNTGDKVMPATFGGHPGFSLPLGGEGDFSDYSLTFSAPCDLKSVVFDKDFYDSGERAPYPLEEGVRMPLSHELFAVDGIFLAGMASAVTLSSPKASHAVTVSYGDAPYLGIWSSANRGKFLCIEPWWGMASRAGVRDIMEKGDMFHLGAGEVKSLSMAMRFH